MADTIRILGQQSGDDYTTLAAALADVPTDITGNNGNWIIQVRGDQEYSSDGSGSTGTTLPSITANASNRPIIEAFPGDEVDGSGSGATISATVSLAP
jgi:hypothetical protein